MLSAVCTFAPQHLLNVHLDAGYIVYFPSFADLWSNINIDL
jgi:hypothetical protein